jgi:hypothetical protein
MKWPFGMLNVELEKYDFWLDGVGRSLVTTQLKWMKAQFD